MSRLRKGVPIYHILRAREEDFNEEWQLGHKLDGRSGRCDDRHWDRWD